MSNVERWTPKPLTALTSENQELSWVWEGYLVKGSVTLLVGLWKAGKTTLLSWLVKGLGPDGESEFAGHAVKESRILFITEESEALWCRRRDQLDLKDNVEIVSRPFLGRPDMKLWLQFLDYVSALVRERKFDLVIFDTLPNLWPVDDENDNAKAITALTPLHAVTEAGAAVLLSAHPRKGDAGEAQAMRGAGATPGFVDIIVELRRYDAERRSSDSRRTLSGYSRYDDTPSELVLDYDATGGYRAVGTKVEATASDRLSVVRSILPTEAPGLTADEIGAGWPEGSMPRPGGRTIKTDLEGAVGTDAGIARTGGGVKGDPHRYYLSDAIPAGATWSGDEQESAADSIPASSISLTERARNEIARVLGAIVAGYEATRNAEVEDQQ